MGGSGRMAPKSGGRSLRMAIISVASFGEAKGRWPASIS